MLPKTMDEVTRHNITEFEPILNWVEMNVYGLSLVTDRIDKNSGSVESSACHDFLDFMVSSLQSSVSELKFWYSKASEGCRFE